MRVRVRVTAAVTTLALSLGRSSAIHSWYEVRLFLGTTGLPLAACLGLGQGWG